MNEQVSLLFRELADLSPAERERVFSARNIPPEVRAELESLLAFDIHQDHAFTACVGQAATEMVRALRGTVQTTATDVYSLGAVLYKMLTGRSPHESETGEVQAIEIVAGTREITAPRRLNPAVPADIECIAQKALRIAPEERYASVEALANDIRAYLASRPVQARSGDAWYRTRKFLRRYWVPLAATALVVASLSVGLYVANRQRAIAESRFREVRQLSNKLFDIDSQVSRLPGSAKVRQFIVDTSLEYLRRLAADGRKDPDLALELANAYLMVARVDGVRGIEQSLGQMKEAERDLRSAEELIQSVLGSPPLNRKALLRAAEIAQHRMVLAEAAGHEEEATVLGVQAATRLDQFGAGESDGADATLILNVYESVAHYLLKLSRPEEALRIFTRGSDLAVAFDRPTDRGRFLNLACLISQYYRGDLDEALRQVRESETLLTPVSGQAGFKQTLNYVSALFHEGSILGEMDPGVSLGRFNDAIPVLERAFTLADEIVHKDANDETSRDYMVDAGQAMADVLIDGDPARALAIYDHAIRDVTEIGSRFMLRDKMTLLADSSYALRRLGRKPEARQRLDAAFELLRRLYPGEDLIASVDGEFATRVSADHEADTGNTARAVEIYQQVVTELESSRWRPKLNLGDAMELSNTWRSLAALNRRSNRADLASAADARRLDLWRQWERRLPNNPFVQRQIAAALAPHAATNSSTANLKPEFR